MLNSNFHSLASAQVSVPSQLSSHRTVLLAVSLLVGLHSRLTAASVVQMGKLSQRFDVFGLSTHIRTAMYAVVT